MTKIIALDRKSDELLGELNNRGSRLFWSDTHRHELDGENSFKFTMPSTIKEAAFFGERNHFLIPSEDNGFEEFIVFHSFTTMDNEKVVTGVAAYTEMDKAHIVNPGTYTGTLQELANMVLPYTDYRLGVFEDINIRTITVEEHIGTYAYLVKLGKLFGMELRFRAEVKGSRFNGRYVNFVQRIGADIKKEVVYGKDLIGIEMTVHSDRIVTELLCIGPEREDGTRLESVVRDEDAFQRWNRKGEPIVGVYMPESSRADMTLEQLEQYGRTELNKRIASVVEYKISAASIENIYPNEKVRLGSTLRIKNPKFEPPLYADARAISVDRSIVDGSRKVYTIGEVKLYTEEEAKRTFRELQRLYGVKMIKSETAPDGQPKTLWIDRSTPLNVPHTFNFETNEWEKSAPTDAGEIGGVVVGQQYNGVSITPEEGVVVERTDGLVRSILNATEGIYIESRTDDLGLYQKVFYADEFGNLTFAGIIRGSQIILGGENNQDGILNVLNGLGELSSEMKAGYFGTEEARVGYLDAPNKVEYADFRGETLTFWVASAPVDGVEPSDENSGTEGWVAPLRTISEAISRIPKSFDGNVRIILAYQHTFNENVEVAGFIGNGRITIDNDGGRNTINGNIVSQKNMTALTLKGMQINSNSAYTALDLNSSSGRIEDCIINGTVGGTTSAALVGAGGAFEFIDCVMNNVDYAVRATFGGNAYVLNCSGQVSQYAFQAYGSGYIAGGGTAPTGEVGNGAELQGGLIRGSWTFPVPPTPPSPTPTEVTKTYSANSDSGTWRADYGGLWDSGSNYGNSVTQGSWSGYGPFTGAFFFGSTLPTDVTGKTIKRIRVQITRQTGGVYAEQNVVIRPHLSPTRPTDNVAPQSVSHIAGIKVGDTRWITLPSSFFAGFESGTFKGLAINGSSYVKLSKTARIEITYA